MAAFHSSHRRVLFSLEVVLAKPAWLLLVFNQYRQSLEYTGDGWR